MHWRTYYRLGLLMPILLPLLLYVMDAESLVSGFLMVSSFIAGIPYLLMIPWFFLKLHRQPYEKCKETIFSLPIYFLFVFWAALALFFLARPTNEIGGIAETLIACFLFSLILVPYVGYFYVVLFFLIQKVLHKLKWLKLLQDLPAEHLAEN